MASVATGSPQLPEQHQHLPQELAAARWPLLHRNNVQPEGGDQNAGMSEEMQQDSVEHTTQALEQYNTEKDTATRIKKEFDKKSNPTWHCIVGRNFSSHVTQETKHFIYFYLGQMANLLFKSG